MAASAPAPASAFAPIAASMAGCQESIHELLHSGGGGFRVVVTRLVVHGCHYDKRARAGADAVLDAELVEFRATGK
jgi:hypothetical protein